jgi:predicted ribosome quality control (RQC) complex YloA/Tae2 family protein
MYFDALTAAAVAAELRAELLEGRVQDVLLLDRLSLSLEIYAHHRRHYLFASAHPQTARMHLMADRPRRGSDAVPPLLLLLRKYVRGARLVDVRQPPAERILHLLFEGPQGPTTLVVETMGRYSNLMLIEEDGAVLDAMKRIGPGTNRYRVVLPSHAYMPPPPQAKLLPDQVTEYRLRQWLAQSPPDQTVRQALVAGIAGISPLAAREIAFRALQDVDAPVASVQRITPLLEAHRSLTTEPPQPCVVYDEDDEVIAFAAYPLTHMRSWQPVDSMSAALVAYFGQESAGYQKAKAPLLEAIASARERLARRRQKLAEERAAAGDPDLLKQMGEAILAYAYQIQPGQAELVAEWLPGQPPLRVPLDPKLSPADNAQAYFRRYRKAQRTGQEIPVQLRQVETDQDYLDQLAQDLNMAESRPEIDAVAQALTQAAYLRPKRKPLSSPAARPLRFTSPDGFIVWVGKNALQNDQVTFRRAAPDDLWLHARGVSGAHVIIQTQGQPVPERTLEWSAGLAAYYSRGRNDTQVEVDVVPRRQVYRLKGGRPGQVTYRHERSLSVVPRHPQD